MSKLEVGDAIDAVDGVKVAAVEQFSKLLKSTKPDQEIVVDFRRKNAAPGTARIKLGKNEDRDYGYLGIAVLDAPWVPFTIDFNLANIGGPSAGMIFSLAVIDKLTTGDLNGGKFIAGTGSIGADGRVGPIGVSRTRWPAPRRRGRGFPGARRQLRRGPHGPRRHHAAGQGRDPAAGRRRPQGPELGWQAAAVLAVLTTAVTPPRRAMRKVDTVIPGPRL